MKALHIASAVTVCALQVNKNWLLKLRLSDQSASACVALKTWNKLGVVGAANVTYRCEVWGKGFGRG